MRLVLHVGVSLLLRVERWGWISCRLGSTNIHKFGRKHTNLLLTVFIWVLVGCCTLHSCVMVASDRSVNSTGVLV